MACIAREEDCVLLAGRNRCSSLGLTRTNSDKSADTSNTESHRLAVSQLSFTHEAR
jgi:hypothetical protein